MVAWQEGTLNVVLPMVMHALNNCIDHGYIFPKKRGRSSGPAELFVTTQRDGGRIVITVADHGAGVDRARLVELAHQHGLDEIVKNDPLEVLFADGMSTAEQVTLTSGRGVGLAAIRAMARASGGDAVLSTPPEGGTKLVIWLPVQAARTAA